MTHERSSGPSLAPGFVVPWVQAVVRPPPTPTQLPPTSRLNAGYRTRRSGALRRSPGRGGPPKFPPPPCERSEPLTPGSPSGLQSRLYTPSVAFAVKHSARLSLSRPKTVALTARQASLEATDRSLAPPKGLSTLGFDPTRFQTEPPACYRASWQLPGPDSHRPATTSLRLDHDLTSSTSSLLGALRNSA